MPNRSRGAPLKLCLVGDFLIERTVNCCKIGISLIDPSVTDSGGVNECNRLWVLKKSLRLAGGIQQKHVRRK